jgi:catechol 2,3-dioxygenase-like lactoylglutathione lyase family enzyme
MNTRGLHHVVVVVRDMELARAHYARVFGEHAVAQVLEVEGYRRCIVPIGAQRLELCQPVGTGDDSGQASSAFRSSLERNGEGVHNVAIEVEDVDAAWSELEAAGVPLIGSALSHSFFVHPKALNGALVQFLGAERR